VIGDAAIKVLLAQPQIGKSPYFFPADCGEGRFIGVVRVLDRVCAMAKLEDVTPHTLRHTFASVAAELGFSELLSDDLPPDFWTTRSWKILI